MRIGGMDMKLRFVRPGAAAVPPSTLLDGLVSYWALSEESGTRVDSVGDNDLTDNNTVGYDTGVNGNASKFIAANGEWLEIEESPVDLTGDFTFTCWFKPNDTNGQTIWSVSNDGSAGEYFFQYSNASGGYVSLAFYVAGSGWSISTTSTGGSVPPTEWTHLMFTIDADGNGTIYVNGSPDGANDVTYPLASDTPTYIGRSRYGQYADGLIDEVAMWSRVLTEDERAELYNSGSGKFYPFT